jgi:hypothetical protein
MHRLLFTAVAGLALAPLAGAAKGAPPTPPPSEIVPPKTGESCGSYGTQIEFTDSPSEAAKKAKKEGKLVFILHVSGHFEDPRFT